MPTVPHQSNPISPPSLTEHEITELLGRWSQGDANAAEAVLPMVYDDLHRIAERYFRRERPDHTLQATAIVHDAYLQLFEQRDIHWNDRSHFIGVVARAMRRILIDYSRKHNAAKRKGRWHRVTLAEADSIGLRKPTHLTCLDEALNRLAEIDPEKARIVELRFFGGLTVDEVARFLELSPATVNRRWRRARAWLYRELAPPRSEESGET